MGEGRVGKEYEGGHPCLLSSLSSSPRLPYTYTHTRARVPETDSFTIVYIPLFRLYSTLTQPKCL